MGNVSGGRIRHMRVPIDSVKTNYRKLNVFGRKNEGNFSKLIF